jgi:hypothetical protein
MHSNRKASPQDKPKFQGIKISLIYCTDIAVIPNNAASSTGDDSPLYNGIQFAIRAKDHLQQLAGSTSPFQRKRFQRKGPLRKSCSKKRQPVGMPSVRERLPVTVITP